MGPDLELKGKSETAPEVLVNKENVSASPFSEEKHLQPANVSVMDVPPIEQTPLFNSNEDVEVNITGITNPGKALMVEALSENVTEYSSSFDDTGIGAENDSALSDAEVESPMYTGNVSSSTCDGWHGPLPISWSLKFKVECGVAGLRALLSSAHPYQVRMWSFGIDCISTGPGDIPVTVRPQKEEVDNSLEEVHKSSYVALKQHEFTDFTRDDFESKSASLSCWTHQNKVMKRRKRKRVEEESDLKSYMSNHNIFSYYENKGCVGGPYSEDVQGVATACNADDPQELGLNNIWSSVNTKDSDKSLEEMIQKIEAAQSRVDKLRSQIGKTKDQILIHNQAAEEELHDHENIKNQLAEKIKVGDGEPNVPSLVRACSTSKSNIPTKTKKGKRKSRSKRK
ncbi:hypothetical protein L6164_006948 [Bauhinia variegata]|uniref:Uncharacterized protein n=1 Tax=Bauhinia variegata TaxID=167791 RepID=A0ACB9PY38_BAUVA|nr:hypothetical protein L6164_006948 [Bauhinia variegata]